LIFCLAVPGDPSGATAEEDWDRFFEEHSRELDDGNAEK
jgi:hypothetical protein